MVALGLQCCDLIRPARAIGPYTMYKNNRWLFVIGVCALAPVATIKVKSRIDLNFDVFMIFDLTLYFSSETAHHLLAPCRESVS